MPHTSTLESLDQLNNVINHKECTWCNFSRFFFVFCSFITTFINGLRCFIAGIGVAKYEVLWSMAEALTFLNCIHFYIVWDWTHELMVVFCKCSIWTYISTVAISSWSGNIVARKLNLHESDIRQIVISYKITFKNVFFAFW